MIYLANVGDEELVPLRILLVWMEMKALYFYDNSVVISQKLIFFFTRLSVRRVVLAFASILRQGLLFEKTL